MSYLGEVPAGAEGVDLYTIITALILWNEANVRARLLYRTRGWDNQPAD